MNIFTEWLRPNRIAGVYEWRDKDGNSHLFVFTPKKVIELDYDTKKYQLVLTIKQIKKAGSRKLL